MQDPTSSLRCHTSNPMGLWQPRATSQVPRWQWWVAGVRGTSSAQRQQDAEQQLCWLAAYLPLWHTRLHGSCGAATPVCWHSAWYPWRGVELGRGSLLCLVPWWQSCGMHGPLWLVLRTKMVLLFGMSLVGYSDAYVASEHMPASITVGTGVKVSGSSCVQTFFIYLHRCVHNTYIHR